MLIDNIGSINTSVLALTANKAEKIASVDVVSKKRTGRVAIEIANTSSDKVYIGGSGVTKDNGLPIIAGGSKIIPVNLSALDNLHIVSASAASVIIAEYYS